MALVDTLRSLAKLLADTPDAAIVSGDPQTLVTGVTQDTRRLQPGELFVAVPGLERDGMAFVPQAVERGAAAIAATAASLAGAAAEVRSGLEALPLIEVAHPRAALADLAAAFYGHPSRQLSVAGVTGTDGKTSTTQLLSAILEAHGLRTGWLTTVNTKIGEELRPNLADHTTPEAPLVQRLLAEMASTRLDVAILETSSHALDLERVRAVDYRVGVFTNLSPEHINFHGSFENYRAAKRKLFERLRVDGLAVVNADDPSSEAMRAASSAPVVTFGLDRPADITATDVRLSPNGTAFTVHDGSSREIRSRLVGRFNVANWLAAYAAARYFGATADDLARAASLQPPVAGRMNLVTAGQPFAVVVDFAHTPQALEKALDTVRSLLGSHGRVLLAFGLAGGRDFANRPVMGSLAARRADFVAITMDDPGDEDPAAIAEAIAVGARAAGGRECEDFVVELDRRAAIRRLFECARPGDAVLLAGKGHERRMVVRGERQPWNDAAVADAVLRDLGFRTQAVP
jgi:UDP-N-acetylmuramoyl-L-alanyl-D-glutamate--2,6-diaminopimelate ligase